MGIRHHTKVMIAIVFLTYCVYGNFLRSIMGEIHLIWRPLILSLLCCHGRPSDEDSRSACDSAPCQNGGQCIDVSYPGGPNTFKCSCKEGYDGLTCQRKIDPCADDPCLNGGICTQRGEHYHCMCLEAFIGKNCETPAAKKDPCSDKPCGVNGVCEVVNGQFVCECLPGYKGPKCEMPEMQLTVVTIPPTEEEENQWIIMDVLISILFFICLFTVLLIISCCHCYRVWNKRSDQANEQKAKEAAGKDPGPTKGWIELSNEQCYDCFCWCFKSKPKPEEPPPERPMYVMTNERPMSDPQNVTGVIVPVRDYDTMVRNGYMCPPGQVPMKQCYREPACRMPMYPAPEPMCVPRDYYRCERVASPPARRVACEPTCSVVPTVICSQKCVDPCARDMCQNQDRRNDGYHAPYQTMRTRPSRMADGDSCPRHVYNNSNTNQEPEYYDDRQAYMSDNCHNDMPSDVSKRKLSRAELQAQHGKNFTPRAKNWNNYSNVNAPPRPSYPYPQGMSRGYANPTPNLDNYPASMPTGTPAGMNCPEFYGNGAPAVSQNPWIPQPYAYPPNAYPPNAYPPNAYPPNAYPYPMLNNIQNNSNPLSSPSDKPREQVQAGEYPGINEHLHGGGKQKLHLGHRNQENDKMQPAIRGPNVGCADSRMDNLHFGDDDDEAAGERAPFLTGETGDDGGSTLVESETDDTLDRGTIDDDGYGSTNKLSERDDTRGRNREPQTFLACPDKPSRNYIARKPKQRLVTRNKVSPRSQLSAVSGSYSDGKRGKPSQNSPEPYSKKVNNSNHSVPQPYQSSDDSTSDEGKGNYHNHDGPISSGKSGDSSHNVSYRTQDQSEDEDYSTSKLVRRGDLWSNSGLKGSQKRFNAVRNEDSPAVKSSSKLERHCPTSAPKKVKGILKNNPQGDSNYNRPASAQSLRKSKEISMNRINTRRRQMRCQDEIEDTD